MLSIDSKKSNHGNVHFGAPLHTKFGHCDPYIVDEFNSDGSVTLFGTDLKNNEPVKIGSLWYELEGHLIMSYPINPQSKLEDVQLLPESCAVKGKEWVPLHFPEGTCLPFFWSDHVDEYGKEHDCNGYDALVIYENGQLLQIRRWQYYFNYVVAVSDAGNVSLVPR